MPYREFQDEAHAWASRFQPPYFPLANQGLQLQEEAGEVAREINHLTGVKRKKPGEAEKGLASELADVLFTCVCIANAQGIDLDDAWRGMMRDRRYGRDAERFSR